MATYSWKDIVDITYNSTDLKAYILSISGVKANAKIQEFHAAGSVWPAPIDTGMRAHDNVTLEFLHDGGASGPAAKCALGTSATLTMTFATGLSVTGTFVVSSVEVGVSSDGENKLTVELTASGTITYDLTA
jgi:hypothetical protein